MKEQNSYPQFQRIGFPYLLEVDKIRETPESGG